MRVNSMMKSAVTYPFMAVREWYCMSNSLNSITHKAIRPAASRLFMTFLNGLSIRTIMVYAWKYDLSFRAVVTNAKASFSIWEYLSSAPQNAWLVKEMGL